MAEALSPARGRPGLLEVDQGSALAAALSASPMTACEFAIALFVLLLTPGPTNTLIALAGAERGWLGALRLTPVEAAAYALVTLPLAIAGEQPCG